jgi:hypothetical protein
MTIHRSLATLAVAVVAFAVVGVATTQASVRGEPPLGQPFSIETASYPLFAVEDSGVTGQLQIVQQVAGGTLFVLTAYRLAADEPHEPATHALAAALYVGSCGPDRPVLLMLEPVGRESDRSSASPSRCLRSTSSRRATASSTSATAARSTTRRAWV